jgi:hypothetical protein
VILIKASGHPSDISSCFGPASAAASTSASVSASVFNIGPSSSAQSVPRL